MIYHFYHFPLPFFCRGEITTQLRTPRLDSNTSDLLNEVTILPGISPDIPMTILKRIGGDQHLRLQKQGSTTLLCMYLCTCTPATVHCSNVPGSTDDPLLPGVDIHRIRIRPV